MIQKTINLYTIDELKEKYPKGYEKALQDWRESNEYWGLEEYMTEYCKELLKENEIEGDPKLFYSLSYCQGDGAMFEGDFVWEGYDVNVKQSGHYYHYNSKDTTITDEEEDDISEDVYIDFNNIYVDICKKLEKAGYDYIEGENEEENILDNMRANEYIFTENGKIDHL